MQADPIRLLSLVFGEHGKTVITGITGHQKIGTPQTISWVREEISRFLIGEDVTEGWNVSGSGRGSTLCLSALPVGFALPRRAALQAI